MKKYTFIIATAVFALTSCSFLDRNPKDKLAPENYFRNEQDFELFSNTFYDNLFNKEPYKNQSDIISRKGAISDELLGGTAREVPTVAGKGGWSWGQLRKINTMLDNMDKCSDEDVVKKYTALGRFFRTRFYFEKVKDIASRLNLSPKKVENCLYRQKGKLKKSLIEKGVIYE